MRLHLDYAVAAQKQAAAELQRSQDWIDRALLDDDRVTVRRLQLALRRSSGLMSSVSPVASIVRMPKGP
ncbi:MAG: hypothetical protein DMG72_18005 [Acidobacteria bacterium]|nr:MAG: hypothetical protein DMG72_18005 [Acidobacteriota bacterium]